jgi:hypothetical protein
MILIVGGLISLSVHIAGQPGLSLPQAPPSGLHGLRACNGNGYDQASHLCNSRLPASPSTIRVIGCSVFVNGHLGQTIHSFLEYKGATVYRGYARIDNESSNIGFSYALTPDDVLPAGRWICGFTLAGSKESTAFNSSGPIEGFLYPAACDGTALQSFGAGLACPASDSRFTHISSAGCSAVLNGIRNTEVDVVVAYGGGSVQPITKTYPISVATGLSVAGVELRPIDYGSEGALPDGTYTCGWIVGGHLVGSKSFQVS